MDLKGGLKGFKCQDETLKPLKPKGGLFEPPFKPKGVWFERLGFGFKHRLVKPLRPPLNQRGVGLNHPSPLKRKGSWFKPPKQFGSNPPRNQRGAWGLCFSFAPDLPLLDPLRRTPPQEDLPPSDPPRRPAQNFALFVGFLQAIWQTQCSPTLCMT